MGAAATRVSVCAGCAGCGLKAWETEAVKRSHALSPPVPSAAPDSLIGEAAAARSGVDPPSSVDSRGGLTLLPISPGWAPATLVWLYVSHGFLGRSRARNTECMPPSEPVRTDTVWTPRSPWASDRPGTQPAG